jgi:hypothetical protein
VTPPTTLETVITCALCGTQSRESMPQNACQHFYPCAGFGEALRPLDGDCCVFCAYDVVACPRNSLSVTARNTLR